MQTSETFSGGDVPAGLNWLSERQREARPLSDDPLLNYCLELEARVVSQSREIEALRQMLRSEHGRHVRAGRPESGSLLSWLRIRLGAG